MKTIKTYKKTFGDFEVKLTSITRAGSSSSNIKVWICLGEHLITVISASSTNVKDEESAMARIDNEWDEFTKYENDKEHLEMLKN